MPQRHPLALACTASVVLALCAAGPAAADGPTPTVTQAPSLERAHQVARRADDLGRRVASQLDEARRARDVVRITCLDDKLAQINSVRRQIEHRTDSLLRGRAAADPQLERHAASVLRVLGQRVTDLDRDSLQCLGQEPVRSGQTTVTTIREPSTPEEDAHATRAPRAWPLPTIPPPASGFR